MIDKINTDEFLGTFQNKKISVKKINEIIAFINTLSSTGTGIYQGPGPTNTQWGNIAPGTNLFGLTYDKIIELATIANIAPFFNSFTILGQPNTVEVGTTISGSKTFNWSINQGTGVVNSLDIYNNNTSSNLVTGTVNDGTESVTIPTVNFTTNGQSQSYKGIGYNTSPTGTFNSANFVITAAYYEFYGPTASNSTTSANVRALPNTRFSNLGNSFTMNTGTTQKIFEIVLPVGKSIISVFDNTAGFDITGSFTMNIPINVNDAASNPVSYNINRLTNAVTYSTNHILTITTN